MRARSGATSPQVPFGERLRAARLRAGLTQQQASDRVAMVRSLYAVYESGRKVPSIEQARRLAEAVGISLARLVG